MRAANVAFRARKTVIVVMTAANLVCGMWFSQVSGALLIVMNAIGLMGPRTKGLELEKISR